MMGVIAAASSKNLLLNFDSIVEIQSEDVTYIHNSNNVSFIPPFIKSDQSKIYFSKSDRYIREYDFITNGNIEDGFTYSNISPLMPIFNRMKFNNDGTKLFLFTKNSIAGSIQSISSYTLSTAWDISTVSTTELNSIDLTVHPFLSTMNDFDFNNDGTELYILFRDSNNSNNESIGKYTLSTAFDLSTAGTISIEDISTIGSIDNISYLKDEVNEYLLLTGAYTVAIFRNGYSYSDVLELSDSVSHPETLKVQVSVDKDSLYGIVVSGGSSPFLYTLYKVGTNL